MKIVGKKRRIECKTNYLKRKLLLEGRKPRVVIRKTNKYIIIQYIESKLAQDSIRVSVFSKELLKYGWPENRAGSLKSLPAAYLTGFLFGNKAKGYPKAIVDTGLIRSTKGSRIYAALKGIIDAGFEMPHNPKVFPEETRIKIEKTGGFFDRVKENITKSSAKEAKK